MVTEQIPKTVNTIENILSNFTEHARDSLARLHLGYSIQQMVSNQSSVLHSAKASVSVKHSMCNPDDSICWSNPEKSAHAAFLGSSALHRLSHIK